MQTKIIIYCDGATSNNGAANAAGGWAYIGFTPNGDTIDGHGFIENATNNICELTAVIRACEHIEKLEGQKEIRSDSAYIINCYKQKWWEKWINNGWINAAKKPVANRELWERLIPYFQRLDFEFTKVQGHSGDYYNEMADKLAVQAKFEKK